MTFPPAYRRFAHKGANFRIRCDGFEAVTAEIVRLRGALESYLGRHREFGESLEPVAARAGAPEIAHWMAAAAERVGVGPMAAVAGAIAQRAAEAGVAAGADEAIVENGGDLYLMAQRTVTVGLYTGRARLGDRLAMSIPPEMMPLAVCSSSSRMGHSLSLGDCDLATVTSPDAALADAAATRAANLVRSERDLDAALERIGAIEGVSGVFLVQADRVGLVGQLPPLVRNLDGELDNKVTRDPQSR